MRRNNIFAIFALSFFMLPATGVLALPVAVTDMSAIAAADTLVSSVAVQVTELSDSTKEALKPEKRELADSKKYGTVKGVVSYDKGEAIENAKLEFVSESDTVITTSSSDGSFSIELLAGEYGLFVSYQEQKIKPIDVKVRAGKTVEISKNKLEFEAKRLEDLEVTALKGKRYVTAHVCDLAKSPLINAELYIYTLPDTQKVTKVLYSDLNGNFVDSLLLGNYLLRPVYLDIKHDDINLTVSNEDVIVDTIVVNNIKHLNLGERMTVKSRDALIAKYKKEIGTNYSPDNYRSVYEHWKEAFCARPDRHLVQYLDGVVIINASIAADTIQKRYDRIKLYNEELMDLFELAIVNIDSLNAQIAGNDTLTVAKLRAQQLEYLRANWQMDTVFRSPIVTKDNTYYKRNESSWYSNVTIDGKSEEINWDNVLFADDMMNTRIYNMARDIVESGDLDLEMKDIDVFAKTMFYKFSQDTARVGLTGARNIYAEDTTLTFMKARSVLDAVDPNAMSGSGDEQVSTKTYYASQLRAGITTRFSEMASWVVDSKDTDRLVDVYRRRWNTEGDDVVDLILGNRVIAANRDSRAAMELYYDALRNKNDKEPSYELLVDIVNRAQRLEKYNDVITYSQRLFAEPEFFEESGYAQARMYVRMVQTYEKLKGSTAQRHPYIQKAIQACPEYPEPYFYLAKMIRGVNLGNQRGILKRFVFCIAYDQFEVARQKLIALEAMGEGTDVKSNLTAEMLKEAQDQCRVNFPYKDDVFLQGGPIGMEDGKPYTLPLPFGRYTSIVRTQERRD